MWHGLINNSLLFNFQLCPKIKMNFNTVIKISLIIKEVYSSHYTFLGEINTFVQQGCIKLIKSDGEEMYNVTKDLYFKQMLFF